MSGNTKKSYRLAERLAVGVAGWTALWVIGCVSLDQMAPPIDPPMIEYGQQRGISGRSLSTGREIYLRRCIGCHSIEPVGRYSLEQWQVIVPEMATEAKLDGVQTADLLAYLLTSRQMLDLPPPAVPREGG